MQITHNLVVAALTELGYAPDLKTEVEFGPIYVLSSSVYISTEAGGGWLLWLDSGEEHSSHCFKFGPNDFGLLLATVSRLHFN